MLFKSKRPEEKKSILESATKIEPEDYEEEKEKINKADLYQGLNLKRLDKEKLINMLGEVIIENRTLADEIAKLESENKEYIKSMLKFEGEVKKTEDKIFTIAQHICPELIIEMNKGTKFSVDGKVNMIIENVLEERRKSYSIIVKLKEQIKDNKILLDNFKNQVVQLAMEKNEYKGEKFDIDKFLDNNTDVRTEAVKETDENGNIKMSFKTVNIQTLKNNLTAKEKAIIDIIGTLGLSELPEILRETESRNLGFTPKTIDDTVKALETQDVLKIDKIKTMNRAAGVQILNLTANIGKPIYKELFNQNAIRSEKELLLRENASYEHGYSIKEVAQILKDFGYLDVSFDRTKNTIDFSGANKWIPDIIAVNAISNKKEYFEVEMGSQGEEVIANKLSKANLKCRYLVIIVTSKLEREKMLRYVRNWYGRNPGSANTITTQVKTFKEFKEKEDGVTIGKGKNLEEGEVN